MSKSIGPVFSSTSRTGVTLRPLQLSPRFKMKDEPRVVVDDAHQQHPQLVLNPLIPTSPRQLYAFARPPSLGNPLPPACLVNNEVGCLSAPAPTPPVISVSTTPPKSLEDGISSHRGAILASCITGLIVLSLIIMFFLFIRPYRTRVVAQDSEQESSEQAVELSVIPEAERKSQMQANLKMVSADDVVVALGDATNSCSICLCDFCSTDQISGSVNPDCQHYFHTECILQAFLQRPKTSHECPVCRREFFPVSSTASTTEVSSSSIEPSEANQA